MINGGEKLSYMTDKYTKKIKQRVKNICCVIARFDTAAERVDCSESGVKLSYYG